MSPEPNYFRFAQKLWTCFKNIRASCDPKSIIWVFFLWRVFFLFQKIRIYMKIQVQSTYTHYFFHEILHQFYSMVNYLKHKFYKLALGSQWHDLSLTNSKLKPCNYLKRSTLFAGRLYLLRCWVIQLCWDVLWAIACVV